MFTTFQQSGFGQFGQTPRGGGGGAVAVPATLILLAGQSNAAGRPTNLSAVQTIGKSTIPATVPVGSAVGYDAIYASTVTWAKIWNAPDLDIGAAGAIGSGAGQFVARYNLPGTAFVNFSAAKDPKDNASDILWGPELAYLWQRWQRDTSKTLYIHKCAIGGTALYDDGGVNWNTAAVATPTRSIALAAVNRTNAALAAMKVADPTITTITVEMLWVQGEADASNNAAPVSYAANFAALLAYMRSALVAPSGTTVSLKLAGAGRVNTTAAALLTTTGRSSLEVVKAAIMATAAAEGAQVTDFDGYTQQADALHYVNAAYIQMGIHMETRAKSLGSYTQANFAVASPSYSFMANRPADNTLFAMKTPSNTPVLGGIASFSATNLPPGCALGVAGFVQVVTPASLVPGTYTPTIRRSNGDGTPGTNAVTPTITIVAENTATLDGRAFVLDPANAGTITSTGGAVSAVSNADSIAASGITSFTQATATRQPGIGTFPGKAKNGLVSDTVTPAASTTLDVMTTGPAGSLIFTDNVLDAIIGCVCRPITGGSGTLAAVAGIINLASGGGALFSLGIVYNFTTSKFGVSWINRGGGATTFYSTAASAVDATHIVIVRQVGARVFISVNGTEQEATLNVGTVPRDAVLLASETGGGLSIFGRNTLAAGTFTGWLGLTEWGISASATQYTNLAARLAAW